VIRAIERRVERGPLPSVEEVWVIELATHKIRRIAQGGWPSWSGDSKRIYFPSRPSGTFSWVSIDDDSSMPKVNQVLTECGYYPVVSPNEQYVADAKFRTLRILDTRSGKEVCEWLAPPFPARGLLFNWSPDSRGLAIGGFHGGMMGLWFLDTQTGEASRMMDGPASHARWSPDRSKIVVAVGAPYVDLWLFDLDPNRPTAEAFGDGRTVEEHCRELIEYYSRGVAADPDYPDSHLRRTDAALWIEDSRAPEFLEELERAFRCTPYHAGSCAARAQAILSGPPELRNKLLPLARLLARKAVEKEPGYARVLAPQFYRAGYHDQAYEIFKAYPNPESGHSRYDQATATYTVTGVGVDIWETVDDFHFAHKSLHGDGSITARIDSIEDVHEWAKAGVMIRSSLDPTSENVMVLVTPNGRVAFQHRHTQAAMTYSTYTPVETVQLPHWVRLTRRSNRFLGEHSCDGIHWQTVLPSSDPDQPASIEITMNETVYLGLAVTSHDATKTAEARVSHVTATGVLTPTGPFNESRDIGFPLPPLPTAAK
jgi:hypothetical protein